jgi:hypothetical protein
MIKTRIVLIAFLLLAYVAFAESSAAQTTPLFLTPQATNPTSCTRIGTIYYNTVAKEYRVCTQIGTPGTWDPMKGSAGTTPGGFTGEVQLNSSGSLGGISGSNYTSQSKLVLSRDPVNVSETSQADFAAGTLTSTQANSDGTLTLTDAANGTAKAVNFNGSRANQISVPHNAAYNISGDITIEAWVYLVNPTAFSPIISKGASGQTFDFVVQSGGGIAATNYGFLRFGQGGSYLYTQSVASLKLNQWQHVAVVKTGTTVKFYINGTLVSTQTGFSPSVPTNTDPLTIGHAIDSAVTEGYIFRGSIFDVRVWNVARSDAEIAANFNTLTPAGSGLLGQWKMQEGSGTTIADTGSGAHNGTLSGTDYAWQTITSNYATTGTRVSPVYDISAAKTISTSNIAWNTITPTGDTVTVETRYSTDSGGTWSSYQTATSGAAIPGLSTTTDLSNGRLQIRETLTSPTSKASPIFQDVKATFTTPNYNFNVGVKNASPAANLDAGTNTIQGKHLDTGGMVINVTAPRYGAIPNDGIADDAAFALALADLGSARDFLNGTGKIVIPKGTYDFSSDLELNHIVILEGTGGSNNEPSTVLSFADGKGVKIPACEVMGGYGTDQGCGTYSSLRDLKVFSKGKANAPTATVNVSGLTITRTAGTVFKHEKWGAGQVVKIGPIYGRILNWLTDNTATLEPLYYRGVVSGSTVALQFGNPFPAGLSGVAVKIDGVSYTISSSTVDTLTLSSSPAETGTRDIQIQSLGTLSGQTMSLFVNHGIETGGTITLSNVSVQGFAGNGIDVNTANWNYDNARNSNIFLFSNVTAIDNEGNGFFTYSSNANASTCITCNGFGNRGSGIFEDTQFGNTYIGPHVDANRMEAFWCQNSTAIIGLYSEGDQPPSRFKHNSGLGSTGPTVISGFGGAGLTYDSDSTYINADGAISNLESLSVLGATTLNESLNILNINRSKINFNRGTAGATSSGEIAQASGGLQITTNTTQDLLTPTDATKSSWNLFLPNGTVDTFKIARAAAGSTTFSNVFTVDATGQVTAPGFTGNGSLLTNLNATNLATGTVATARLGSGSATSSTFLRGDNTWATPAGGGASVVAAYQAADAVYTSNATLGNTSLSVSVATGGIYAIEVIAQIDNGPGFFQCDFNGGTATIANFRAFAVASPLTGSTITPLSTNPITSIATSTAFGASVEQKGVVFKGSVEITTGGTFIFRAAQFSSNATSSTLFRGSSMTLTKLN